MQGTARSGATARLPCCVRELICCRCSGGDRSHSKAGVVKSALARLVRQGSMLSGARASQTKPKPKSGRFEMITICSLGINPRGIMYVQELVSPRNIQSTHSQNRRYMSSPPAPCRSPNVIQIEASVSKSLSVVIFHSCIFISIRFQHTLTHR